MTTPLNSRDATGHWLLTWFDNTTDELVRELLLTDDMRYGEIPIETPPGQSCFIGFVVPPFSSSESGQHQT